MQRLFFLFLLLRLLHASGEACVLIFLYPNLTLDRLIKGDLSLCLLYVWDLLDCVQKDLHEVVMVKAEYLYKKVISIEKFVIRKTCQLLYL